MGVQLETIQDKGSILASVVSYLVVNKSDVSAVTRQNNCRSITIQNMHPSTT